MFPQQKADLLETAGYGWFCPRTAVNLPCYSTPLRPDGTPARTPTDAIFSHHSLFARSHMQCSMENYTFLAKTAIPSPISSDY
eukprot:scaffold582_cov73-Cylindrotheca_fusiformis.AAC.3